MAQSKTNDLDVYQPRKPKVSAYYRCVENHFEELEQNWDDKYASRYGFWRRYIMTTIFKSLTVVICILGLHESDVKIADMSIF